MSDIITVGVVGTIVYATKESLAKLLGPTAEYLGDELKDLVKKSKDNVESVFRKAERKCGANISKPGVVNPRVFKHIYDEARVCENELLAEYFGGVLASSRSEHNENDMGVYYTQIVQSLSIYQLRCHYLFYYLIWNLSKGKTLNLNSYDDRAKLIVVIHSEIYEKTFNITDKTIETVNISHSLAGLSKADLINSNFSFISPEELNKIGINYDNHSFIIEPTITGIELFVWVHGKGQFGINEFLNPELLQKPDLDIKMLELAKLKSDF